MVSKTALLASAALLACLAVNAGAQPAVQAKLMTRVRIWGLSQVDVSSPSAAASITSATTADFRTLISAMLRVPALDYVPLSTVSSSISPVQYNGYVDVAVTCSVTGSDAVGLGLYLAIGLTSITLNHASAAPYTVRTMAAAIALRPNAPIAVNLTGIGSVPVNANGTIVPTPMPSRPPLGPASATATLAVKISGVTVDVLNGLGMGTTLTSMFRQLLNGFLAGFSGSLVPISNVNAYLTPDATGTAALVVATAGFPQLVDGMWPLLGAALNAQLTLSAVTDSVFPQIATALRMLPGLANFPIALSFNGASAAPGAPSPGVPIAPSVAPYPVAQITATLQFNGVPAVNVSLADAAALCDALVYDLTRWAQAMLPVQVRQFVDAPAALVLGAQSMAAGGNLQVAVSSNVFGFPALATVLASALRPLLTYPATQAGIIPTTLMLATAVMGRTPGAMMPTPMPAPGGGGMMMPNATITLIAVTATGTDPNGGLVMTPLPSPAAPTTVSTLTFNFRLNATFAAVNANSALRAALILRLATAVASQLSLQIGVTLSPSDITVTISAATSTTDARMLVGAGGGVVLTASAPVREAVPGTAALYADATSAAFQSSPALLAPVTEAASAALGQPVTASVTGASAGPSGPANIPNGGVPGSNGGAVAGGVIGGLLLAALVAAGGVFAVRRSRARAAQVRMAGGVPTITTTNAMVSDFEGGAAVKVQVRLAAA